MNGRAEWLGANHSLSARPGRFIAVLYFSCWFANPFRMKFALLLVLLLAVSPLLAGCTDTLDRELGGGYVLSNWGPGDVLYQDSPTHGSQEVLVGGIVHYGVDEDFILVQRQLTPEVLRGFNDHSPAELMQGGDSVQYWIIKKRTAARVGPLDGEAFKQQRQQLEEAKKLTMHQTLLQLNGSRLPWDRLIEQLYGTLLR